MRFRIVIKNMEPKIALKKLQPFGVEQIGQNITIDLNSWGAFSTLEKTLGKECKVYSAKILTGKKKFYGYPLLEFD